MAINYPSGTDTLTTHADNVNETVKADDINKIQEIVRAIEDELGTLPKGDKSNVRIRFEDAESRITSAENNLTNHQNASDPHSQYALDTDLNAYMPKAGGDFTNDVTFPNAKGVKGKKVDGTLTNLAYINATDQAVFGSSTIPVRVHSSTDPIVNKGASDLTIWHDGLSAKSLVANGYVKLPNGLYLQWGTVALTVTPTDYNFPIAFPNACYSVVGSLKTQLVNAVFNVKSTSQFTASMSVAGSYGAFFIAIGY